MKPQNQFVLHDPENGKHGDCQRAVIASLLELYIEEVPHFLEESQNDTAKYWELLQGFLSHFGYAYLVVPAFISANFFGNDEQIYHEISGPSPRGNDLRHAVVGCNGVIVHDPHPDKTGLTGDPNLWEHSYLVKLCN